MGVMRFAAFSTILGAALTAAALLAAVWTGDPGMEPVGAPEAEVAPAEPPSTARGTGQAATETRGERAAGAGGRAGWELYPTRAADRDTGDSTGGAGI